MAADKSNSIAMIYAEAIFELADEQQQMQTLRAELEQLAQLIKDNLDFQAFLESPAINRRQKTAVLLRIFENRFSPLMLDFLKVVAAKDRLNLLTKIKDCFVQLENKQAGRVKGMLTTAIKLSGMEKNRLTEQVSRALRKNVTLQYRVDPSIIGGMFLNIEDTIMDASVKGSLQQLTKRLRFNAAEKLPRGWELITE